MAGGLVAAGGIGLALVARGDVPGHQLLDQLDGACSVAPRTWGSSPVGPTVSGQFFSRARGRTVGYSIAYPPGHAAGDTLPLVVVLHAHGGDHTSALSGRSLSQALALQVGGSPSRVAIAAADGGGGYWHAHPGDDPMAMLVQEFIPLCQARGLGRGPGSIGVMGTSMGGYGALLLAEQQPALVAAAGAVSPAIWTGYPQARAANAEAFASATDFAAHDVVTGASTLASMPVLAVSGRSDPFGPGVRAFARAAPATVSVEVSHGCHTEPFFSSHEPLVLRFVGGRLRG